MAERDEAGSRAAAKLTLWRTEAGGTALAAELGGLGLRVEAVPHRVNGDARFLVRRGHAGDGPGAGVLVGSGVRATVAEAMRAAEQVAGRLAP